MFGLFGNNNGGGDQSQQPAQSEQQQQQSSQQPNQQQQPTPQQQQQQQQPVPQVDLSVLLGLSPAPSANPAQNTPEQQAQAALAALMGGAHRQQNDAAPAINPAKLAEHLATMDLTGGLDFNAVFGTNLDETGLTNARAAMNNMQMSTFATMVPLMNALVRQGIEQSTRSIMEQVQQGNFQNTLLNTFQKQQPNAVNPATQPFIASLANLIAQNSPKGTDPGLAAQQMMSIVKTLGESFAMQQQPIGGGGQNTDMSNIFSK